jgi:hypothetical protein
MQQTQRSYNRKRLLRDGYTVKKARGTSFAQGEARNPLNRTYFFQELPQDIQQGVLEGVRFRLTYNDLWQGLDDRISDLNLVRDEIADDRISQNNSKRTVRQWLAVAETET